MRLLYTMLMWTVFGIGWPLWLPPVLLSEKRRRTVVDRLGLRLPRSVRQLGRGLPPLWVHALSVGEVMSAVPLVHELVSRFGPDRVLLSVSTLTGRETALARIPAGVLGPMFFPYDLPPVVDRLMSAVDPVVVVIVETDIWPNIMARLDAGRTPVVLANARLSPRTLAGYRRLKPLIGPALNRFSMICAQSDAEAGRFRRLGVNPDRVVTTGNIKFDQLPDPASDSEAAALAQRWHLPARGRRIVAGSTHSGEEALLSGAFRVLRADMPDLRLIVVPRDPERAADIQRRIAAPGFRVVRSSRCRNGRWDILIVDILGVLRTVYRLADISFVGGSLVPRGGHNPLEPAMCAVPVLFGPHMTDFTDIADKLTDGGGGISVVDERELTAALQRLLGDPQQAREMGACARRVCTANQGAVARTMAVIERVVPI